MSELLQAGRLSRGDSQLRCFSAEQGFGFNKAAHAACVHLAADNRCGIHAEVAVRGFPACAAFDCHGAGQFVTHHLFAGKSWRSSPEIATRMFALYAKYRPLHELMALLDLAMTLVPEAQAGDLEQCRLNIERSCRSGTDLPGPLAVKALHQQVRQLLVELRPP